MEKGKNENKNGTFDNNLNDHNIQIDESDLLSS